MYRWLEANTIPATDLSEIAPSFVNINTPADLERFRRSIVANSGDELC